MVRSTLSLVRPGKTNVRPSALIFDMVERSEVFILIAELKLGIVYDVKWHTYEVVYIWPGLKMLVDCSSVEISRRRSNQISECRK